MVLTESFQVQLGSSAIPFSLRGTDEQMYSLDSFKDAKVLAVVFMCNHCPYVQACIERLIDLQREFADRGVRFVGINSNDSTGYPEDNFEAMKLFSRQYGMNFPYLIDESQEVARAYHAVCTPDIFVYDLALRLRYPQGMLRLRYHGRIDNNWKDPSKATSHELRNALEAMTSSGVVSEVQYPAMGCSIKWR